MKSFDQNCFSITEPTINLLIQFIFVEIIGGEETPFFGGVFKLEVQIPERLVLFVFRASKKKKMLLTLYLIYQFEALLIQQQIKIWCQKYGQLGIQLSDLVENIVGIGEIANYEQFLLFPQCFQKLSVVDASK